VPTQLHFYALVPPPKGGWIGKWKTSTLNCYDTERYTWLTV